MKRLSQWWNKQDVEFSTTVALDECERRLQELGAKTFHILGSNDSEIGFNWDAGLKKKNYFVFLLGGPTLHGNLKPSSAGVLVKASYWPPFLSLQTSIWLDGIILAFFYIKFVTIEHGSVTRIILGSLFLGIVELLRWLIYRWFHPRWNKLAASLKEALLTTTYVSESEKRQGLVWTPTDSVIIILLGVSMAVVLILLGVGILLGSAYLLKIIIRP